MRKCWHNQEVNLKELAVDVSRFLEANGFNVVLSKCESGYQLVAEDSACKLPSSIVVFIEGIFDGFAVNLELSDKKAVNFSFPVLLATMFGGGFFYLKRLRSNEAWIDFQKKFWAELNNLAASWRVGKADDAV